ARFEELVVAREKLVGVDSEKAAVGVDEPANERLGGKLAVLIALKVVQELDAHLGRGRDLLERNAALFAFLTQEFAERKLGQGSFLSLPNAWAATRDSG